MDTGAVRVKYTGLWIILQGRGPSCPTIQVRDVGPDDLYGPDPRGCPPQGGQSDYWASAVVMSQRGVVLLSPGGVYAGGGAGDD